VNLDRLQRAPNIAIVGSTSPVGKELKDLVQESGIPFGKVSLIDTEIRGSARGICRTIQITQVISHLRRKCRHRLLCMQSEIMGLPPAAQRPGSINRFDKAGREEHFPSMD
jgi:hypothetical protein